MSLESNTDLSRSLDAIDGMRRRIHMVGLLVVVGTLGAFANLAYVQRVSDNIERLLGASVLALMCVIAWTTFAIVLIVVRMTKRILRAIDLALRAPRL